MLKIYKFLHELGLGRIETAVGMLLHDLMGLIRTMVAWPASSLG